MGAGLIGAGIQVVWSQYHLISYVQCKLSRSGKICYLLTNKGSGNILSIVHTRDLPRKLRCGRSLRTRFMGKEVQLAEQQFLHSFLPFKRLSLFIFHHEHDAGAKNVYSISFGIGMTCSTPKVILKFVFSRISMRVKIG